MSLGGGWGSLVLVRHEQDHFARLCRSALGSFVTVCKAPAACSTTQPLTWGCVCKGAEYRPETLRLSCSRYGVIVCTSVLCTQHPPSEGSQQVAQVSILATAAFRWNL